MSARIAELDIVRGFAVMGILLLNIVDFGLPSYAYLDPAHHGGAEGASLWTWATVFVLFDGKMRGLFAMLFGASTLLVAARAEEAGRSAWATHYARMGSLLLFGLAHAYFVWAGDILVSYALCGALLFLARRWPTGALVYAAVALLAFRLALAGVTYGDIVRFDEAAAAPTASTELREKWRVFADAMQPGPEQAEREIAAYRGSYGEAFAARAGRAWWLQRVALPLSLPDTLAMMLIGMALFRSGFLSGGWSRRRYWLVAGVGFAVGLPAEAMVAEWVARSEFSPIVLTLSEPLHLVGARTLLSVAWAALFILFAQARFWRGLRVRVAAVGRAAFSNYLGASIVCTLIFNGYGLGLYGKLDRWQLYPVVFGVWVLMLLWSKPWLDRFAHGPFEWAWRRLAKTIAT